MKHKYVAKIYFNDGQIIENSGGDNLEELIAWMSDQAESAFSDLKGEIFDNHTHNIVKCMNYSPPNE